MNNNTSMNKPKSNTGLVIGLSLVVLLIIAVIGFFMYKQFNPAHTSGDSCTPSDKEKVDNAESTAYQYESDGTCVPTACVDKYRFDSSTLTCTKIKTSGKCTPSSAEEVDNAESDTYEYDSDGDCEPTGCVKGYTPSKNPFKCNKNAGPTPPPTPKPPSDFTFKIKNKGAACMHWVGLDQDDKTYNGNDYDSQCANRTKTISLPTSGKGGTLHIHCIGGHSDDLSVDQVKAKIGTDPKTQSTLEPYCKIVDAKYHVRYKN